MKRSKRLCKKAVKHTKFQIPFFNLSLALALFTGFCMVMLALRIYVSGSIIYAFLYWNLFLAVVPFLCSLVIYRFFNHERFSALFVLLLLVWLFFFPNAPYIVTDFLHLKQRAKIPYWYDVLLIFSFAYNGVILALASLRIVHIVLIEKIGGLLSWLFIGVTFFLTGFGVYLGRYLRWNSWDLIQDPLSLFNDIFIRFSDPMAHPKTFGLTFIIFWMMLLSYISILLISQVQEKKK